MTLSFRAQAAFTKLNYQPFYRDCMETTETKWFSFLFFFSRSNMSNYFYLFFFKKRQFDPLPILVDEQICPKRKKIIIPEN